MRKIYAFIAFAIMMIVPSVANAWSYDIPNENTVLESEDYNMRLYKDFDFFNGRFNGETMTGTLGDGCLNLSTDKASFKLNGFDSFQVVSPEEMSSFYIQIGTGAINLRAGVNKDGLHNYGSGSRFFAIADVKEGQIIVCQWGVSSSRASVVQPGSAISGADACSFEDITETIHAAQDESAGEVEEGVATHDNFSYWRATSDGFFVIELQRDCCIQGLQIWIDSEAQEAVTSPSLKLTKVNGDARSLEFKAGESTLNKACTTWYGIVDRGEEALFLEDSEEVDHIEYEYQRDDDGNIVYENDEPVIISQTPVYKKKFTDEAISSGEYGTNLFNPEDGSIDVYASDDEDGDGFVEIQAATVSETGMFSDIVTIRISVGEITLNAPTLTLTGIDGVDRTYTVSWTNNTLCGEDWQIYVTGDDEEIAIDYDINTIGEPITVRKNVKAIVRVEGYLDGVAEIKEVLEPGVNFFRKNSEKAEVGAHDWDFVITDPETKALLKGMAIDYCYLESDPDTHYSAEEYEAGESVNHVDLSNAVPVYIQSGWTWDGGRGRATLDVAQYQDEVDAEVWHPLDEGIDKNDNGFGYVDALYNPFTNGLSVSCPPNTKNASCILQYVDKDDLGIYFMSRPTLTFSREAAQYGEYVLVYQGAGGSNYTNSRWPSLYSVPADALLSFQLNSGGIHVFYIDVYTKENLEEDPYVVGIGNVKAEKTSKLVYSIDGRIVNRNGQINGLQKGLYIINGQKVMVK